MNRTGGKVQFAARFVFMRLFVVCKFVYSYHKFIGIKTYGGWIFESQYGETTPVKSTR